MSRGLSSVVMSIAHRAPRVACIVACSPFPRASILWPGSIIVFSSGMPRNIAGIVSTIVWVIPIEMSSELFFASCAIVLACSPGIRPVIVPSIIPVISDSMSDFRWQVLYMSILLFSGNFRV